MKGLILNGWSDPPAHLLPGAHIVLLGVYADCVKARHAKFEVRDTLLVLSGAGATFAFLLRKPCQAATVAENVLMHGTGALNIDACRVAGVPSKPWGQIQAHRQWGPGREYEQEMKEAPDPAAGRWPPNLVFVHGPGCRQAGVSVGESVPAWDCAPGCLAVALDQQSGERPGSPLSWNRGDREKYGVDLAPRSAGESFAGYGDTGGASRFYPQFKDTEELHAWFKRLIGIEDARSV